MKYSCNRILNNNENEETTVSVYVFYKHKVELEKQKAKNPKQQAMILIIQSSKRGKRRPGVRNYGPWVKSGLTSDYVNCFIGTQTCSFLYALPMGFFGFPGG